MDRAYSQVNRRMEETSPLQEEVFEQQKRLDHQRAIRESKQQNNKGQ